MLFDSEAASEDDPGQEDDPDDGQYARFESDVEAASDAVPGHDEETPSQPQVCSLSESLKSLLSQ